MLFLVQILTHVKDANATRHEIGTEQGWALLRAESSAHSAEHANTWARQIAHPMAYLYLPNADVKFRQNKPNID